MAEIKEAKAREEMPKESQWDLTTMFPSDEACYDLMEALTKKVDEALTYKGRLKEGKETIIKALEAILAVYRDLEMIIVYAHLKQDQDTGNSQYLELYGKASGLFAETNEKLAWFDPELLTCSEADLKALAKDEHYGHYFEQLLERKPHVLSPEVEAVLAGAGEIFDASEETFSMLNNADLTFDPVKGEDGKEISLTHGTYGVLLESTDREVRKEAFMNMYKGFKGVNNTLASTMRNNIKGHNYTAKLRDFKSARAQALAANHIPEEVYESLLDVVHEYLPSFQEYLATRKERLGLDELHMYDLYTPIAGEAPLRYTFEEAKEVVLEALSPLGETYINDLKKAFAESWIDVYENKGKRSGAYSSGAYDSKPYILLNWQDSLGDLYTLVHELGHSMHSYYTRKHQPYLYGDYSIFVAEIASTTNENLLTDYLLKTIKDPAAQIYILNKYLDGFKGTIFRQTQFAEFEHIIHEADAKGTTLSADFLNQTYFDLNAKYYGDGLVYDDEIAYEWSRIPHFYYNYYVYQYSTGFSAATMLAERILTGEEEKVQAYLNYLASGSSAYPIDVMKRAGVDMTNTTYLEKTMAQFKRRLKEFQDLLHEEK